MLLTLTLNRQSDKGFLLTSTFVPKGLSAPALGLYMYKSIKIYTRTRCQMRVYRNTGPLFFVVVVVVSIMPWFSIGYYFYQWVY